MLRRNYLTCILFQCAVTLHGWKQIICSFFLLFRQLADDEALIMLLQTSLFLVFPYAADSWESLSSRYSLTSSIHLFLCPLHKGFLVFLPDGDQSSPSRVRRPLSLSGVLPIPTACVSLLFRVPGEPVHHAKRPRRFFSLGLHLWWHSLSRQSPTSLLTPPLRWGAGRVLGSLLSDSKGQSEMVGSALA